MASLKQGGPAQPLEPVALVGLAGDADGGRPAQFGENPARLAVNGLGVESVRTRAGFSRVRVLPPAP